MLLKKDGKATNLKWRAIGLLGKLFLDGLFILSPSKTIGLKKVSPLLKGHKCIIAFWHSRILYVAYRHKGINAAIMISDSADGEIIAQIVKRQGHLAIRGSTGKGGLRALSRLIIAVRQGHIGVVVPDGPQGPRRKVQPGVIMLAAKTGVPIVPVSYSTKYRKVFPSWDRFLLPFPFSPCILVYGKPVWIPQDADKVSLENSRLELETELNRITALADGYFGHETD